ncbi:Protein CBG10631 [Caenorhabditis briggsae]|uniref:Protein CBG10631 n=1 Tax=Caenorhabditis briggsae TaxID=6238 RepID=A8XBH6_CAEBR|nr:Protein CBG10631 [Caenorhabditis briggsae]CAP29991.1 Protein CBG10631 [Caenorhabditis briggsae]
MRSNFSMAVRKKKKNISGKHLRRNFFAIFKVEIPGGIKAQYFGEVDGRDTNQKHLAFRVVRYATITSNFWKLKILKRLTTSHKQLVYCKIVPLKNTNLRFIFLFSYYFHLLVLIELEIVIRETFNQEPASTEDVT